MENSMEVPQEKRERERLHAAAKTQYNQKKKKKHT